MMFTIHKGTHRGKPKRFGLWFNKQIIQHDVMFHHDCAYHIDGIDMMDTNKLFGIGYLWNHHTDSVRIGWRYNSESDKIILSAYAYVKKERIIIDISEVSFGRYVRCKIKVEQTKTVGRYIFYVDGESTYIEFTHKKKWAYPLGVWFGGNKAAPSTMHIDIK